MNGWGKGAQRSPPSRKSFIKVYSNFHSFFVSSFKAWLGWGWGWCEDGGTVETSHEICSLRVEFDATSPRKWFSLPPTDNLSGTLKNYVYFFLPSLLALSPPPFFSLNSLGLVHCSRWLSRRKIVRTIHSEGTSCELMAWKRNFACLSLTSLPRYDDERKKVFFVFAEVYSVNKLRDDIRRFEGEMNQNLRQQIHINRYWELFLSRKRTLGFLA